MRPIALAKHENALRISWDDDVTTEVSVKTLRDTCPCALCREKRDAAASKPPEMLPMLAAGPKSLELASMTPVGNYAYNIAFSDGHAKGIYSFEMLRELGEEVSD